MAGPEPILEAEAGGRLTIDLAAMVANWRLLAARAPASDCAAAVKADAYGTGIETTVPALASAGCRTFFVAQLAEARAVRRLAPEAAVYVLNGFRSDSGDAYAAADLRPVLGSPEDLLAWRGFVAASGWSGGAALHVDTGMNRLGLPCAIARELEPGAGRFTLLMSHLACADQPQHPLNQRQVEAFAAIRGCFPELPASLANSSGLFLDQAIGFDMVRPGYALYGGNPVPGRSNPMRRVVGLEARILQIREIEAGESVGYGATWSAERPTRLAILDLGYADGFSRRGSSNFDGEWACVAIAGRRCPVAGRISMDLSAVDIGGLAPGSVAAGDFAEVIGPTIDLDEVGRRTGTIGYEVLTSLGHRFARRILPA